MMHRQRLLIGILACISILFGVSLVNACGGLFCQTVPVDQNAERIIFTINDDNTVTAYVQINFTGNAPDFSWVVPVPSVPEVDVAEMASFTELQMLTDPIFISPLMPDCAEIVMPVMAADAVMEGESGVEVLAAGTAGPYEYEVVTSEDPDALIVWLRDNDYQITQEMEPLVHVYTDEGMVFLAMKLQPEQGAQDIQPVVMTYIADYPTIPIRLTAVAANPNMSIYTWVFADGQVEPLNYAHPTVSNTNIRADFFSFGGTNYMTVVDQTIDLYKGRAFITEYAMPTSDLLELRPQDPLITTLAKQFPYMTRLFGRMSPEEMTADPSFVLNQDLRDQSNVHDLSQFDDEIYWGCKEQPLSIEFDPNVVPEGF